MKLVVTMMNNVALESSIQKTEVILALEHRTV